MTPFQIYLIGQADRFSAVFCTLGAAALVVCLTFLICTLEDFRRNPGRDALWLGVVILGLCLLVIGVLIPSSKTLAAMYIIPPIVNNEELRQDAGDIYRLAVEFTKDTLTKPEGDSP
jgi:predicted branched-subunit amino acid permease